jgi:hypothetical protein
MEHSNYELVRYPSGQLVLTKSDTNAQGLPAPGPKDVVGVFTDETEARSALARLVASHGLNGQQAGRSARRG